MKAAVTPENRLLRIYAWYRLTLSGLLLLLFFAHLQKPLLDHDDPGAYLHLAILYFIFNSLCVFLNQDRIASTSWRALIFVLADILALTLFIHLSGGITSNLPLLLAVSIAAGNILLRPRLGLFVSAIATLTLLYEQIYFIYEHGSSWQGIETSAFLGLGFFTIALLSQQLADRLRQGEALALAQERRLREMHTLSRQILRRMRTGILVIDEQGTITMSNQAASTLLDVTLEDGETLLTAVAPRLAEAMHSWQRRPAQRTQPFQNHAGAANVYASFTVLDGEAHDVPWSTLIFLEDYTQLTQQAQQLKLASLGRFSASIAHEIRNPMGAISHAAQLLAESPVILAEDARLLQIIQQHCLRMNDIVENVLQLSRRENSRHELFDLTTWLESFIDELRPSLPTATRIQRQDAQTPLIVRFDPNHLYQVLQNLVSNGLRYSGRNEHDASILLRTGLLPQAQPYLDVIDSGPGVEAALRQHLFEPFFTTEARGTGLGLYLARELCEASQARLDYIDGPQTCFRITFAHPDRSLQLP